MLRVTSAATPVSQPRVLKAVLLRGSATTKRAPAAAGAGDSEGTARYRLECDVLISAHVPEVDDHIFAAVHSNSLVFDGRLIVDSRFRALSASGSPAATDGLFAVGSLAKFSRRCLPRAPSPSPDADAVEAAAATAALPMQNADPRALGRAVAASVLTALSAHCALEAGEAAAASAFDPAVPSALRRTARVRYGALPGGFFCLDIAKPGPAGTSRQPPLRLLSSCSAVRVGDREGRFCQAVIDRHGIMASILYFGPQAVSFSDARHMQALVGLPFTYFEPLFSKADEQGIDDLFR